MLDNRFVVKVCGMTDAGNISDVMASGADWIGLVFDEESPGCLRMRPAGSAIVPDGNGFADGDDGLSLSSEDNRHGMLFGVFKDDMSQNIITRIVKYHLDGIQLDGNEPPVLIRNLRRSVVPDISNGIKVMKAIKVCCAEDLQLCERYYDCVDCFLFEISFHLASGECGRDVMTVLSGYSGCVPFIIGGDISYEDAARIKSFSHPRCIGVDIGQHFETEPGIKDALLIGKFISGIRKP
ncbi:phosphoribosylanthranilate isomerase [Xylanibacter muris]|uniref:N-(5'-phosphoribosyl)anthranilate isomerase n=1 Tax=Xylanibacter muris TaxID=2736290 RepID=A0ABX2AQF5_9BACT|nr:phosphoribosylanthranilate isomerase [Xylanibacter muris]NPD92171.1 phosphoribosylanthranilate isomerase [Xylanibacter muris]